MIRRTISQRSELIYDLHSFGINLDTREIFLHPDPSTNTDEAEIDHRVANTFIKNIRFLDHVNNNPIVIHMCTCGGSWEYGLAIYDSISSSRSLVYLISYAHARSMSGVVLQAADYRILTPNAYFMMHHGQDGWSGSSPGLVTHAEQAKKSQDQMLNIFVEKCKNGPYFTDRQMSEKRITTFLQKKLAQKQEWYLTAEETIEYGLADYIYGVGKCPTIKEMLSIDQ